MHHKKQVIHYPDTQKEICHALAKLAQDKTKAGIGNRHYSIQADL